MKLIAAILFVASAAGVNADETGFFSGSMAKQCRFLIDGMTDQTTVDSDPNAYAMTNWVYGFFTGSNVAGFSMPNTYDMNSLTVQEIWTSVYGYCVRNPDEPGYKAAVDLLKRVKMVPRTPL